MTEQAKRRPRRSAAGSAAAEPTFGTAIDEVERILARLESEQVDVDDLAREVRRAVELIALCRGKLATTEMEVRDYVDALQASEPASAAGAVGRDAPAGDRDGDTRLPF